MNRITGLLALLTIILCLVTPNGGPPLHAAGPTHHYLGGWTRTTQYTDCCVTASGRGVFFGELAAPTFIPFGARVTIPGLGVFTALDRGGAVQGNHLDIWVSRYPFPGIRDWYRGVYWTA